MSDSLLCSAGEMLADLRARRVSAVEQLMAHIARHEAQHGRLNAVITTDIDRARADAQGIDDARARGEALGPLAGLPMTIKDTFEVAGMPAVVGNPHYRGRDKDCADADVVAAVRAAGAVIWGKTNVPFMAADVQTDNAVYGRTNNPHDVTRTPGGSSGGAAAALAAGITPLEIGSDIGGSLRTPGNFCGVVALKTTYGALSSLGHIPPAPGVTLNSDLGVVGPMARTTRDVRLLFAILSGAPATPRRSVQGLRIAVWDEGLPVSAEVLAGMARAAEALAAQGVHVARIAPPLPLDALLDSYLWLF